MSDFGYNLGIVQNNYIAPLDTRLLIQRALLGIAREPSPVQGAVQSIVLSEVKQILALQTSNSSGVDDGTSDSYVAISDFADAVQSVEALQGSPSLPLILSAATNGMLCGADQKAFDTPSSIPQGQANLDDQSLSGQQFVDLATPLIIGCGSLAPLIQPTLYGTLVGPFIYIRISAFNAATVFDLESLYLQLHYQANKNEHGLILDFRFNHGGYLDSAVKIAGLFLSNGSPIATMKGRRPENNQDFQAYSWDITSGLPIGILVNGETSGGAEMVAGALQADHRAFVLGAPTAGFGFVSTLIPLREFRKIRLITSQIILPDGKALQSGGLIPDMIIHTPAANGLSVFGPEPTGEPVEDVNAGHDYDVQQATKALMKQ